VRTVSTISCTPGLLWANGRFETLFGLAYAVTRKYHGGGKSGGGGGTNLLSSKARLSIMEPPSTLSASSMVRSQAGYLLHRVLLGSRLCACESGRDVAAPCHGHGFLRGVCIPAALQFLMFEDEKTALCVPRVTFFSGGAAPRTQRPAAASPHPARACTRVLRQPPARRHTGLRGQAEGRRPSPYTTTPRVRLMVHVHFFSAAGTEQQVSSSFSTTNRDAGPSPAADGLWDWRYGYDVRSLAARIGCLIQIKGDLVSMRPSEKLSRLPWMR
jgi:hypothetical protein